MDSAAIEALDRELRSLVADERKGLVQFLRRLDVLDREQAFAALSCGSAFDYLVRKLHLAEGTAWRRVNAMKLLRRFPRLAAALEDGRINTTQLGILAPVLTEENLDELVRRAAHLSKERTKELVVSIRPPDVPAPGLRRLPSPTRTLAPGPPLEPPVATDRERPTADAPRGPSPVMGLRNPEAVRPLAIPDPTASGSASRPVLQTRIEPVAASRWQWRIGLDEERRARLDTLLGYLAHKIPDGDLEKVFDQMLSDSLEKHGKRLGFVEPANPRPAPEKPATPGLRASVPRAVRRAVLKRDGYRCTAVGRDGERCPETRGLEMDHLEPARETGSSRVDDLTTRCRVHNQYRARLRYGAEYVRRRIDEARREREARRVARATSTAATACEPVAPWVTGLDAFLAAAG